MKLYYVKQETKRFQPLGIILAEYLNLKMNILNEEDIIKIVEKSDLIYFVDNTDINSKLNISDKYCLLGPDKKIANKWNNKIFQYNSLSGIIKTPLYKTYKSFLDIILNINDIKKDYKKFIIFESIGESGKNCLVCDENTSNATIYTKFRASKNKFRISEYIDNVHNISLHFIIADINKFWISPIVDQIIEKEILFKGGRYPSIISNKIKDKVIEETSKVAEVLSKDGYVGLCHIDFMISNGDVYFTEINPRKAGTTICMSYMMENCFNYSIPIIEYHAVKEKRIIDVKQIKEDIPWRLSLIPYEKNQKNSPSDERKIFKLKESKTILYNESYDKHSFKIETYGE